MSMPYACRACRARLLLSHLRSKRIPASLNFRSQTTFARSFHPWQTKRGQEHVPESSFYDAGSNSRIKGRYSGKELKPEELLSQLDEQWQSHVAATRPDFSRTRPESKGNHFSDPPHLNRRGELSPSSALGTSARSFIQHTYAQDLGRAWSSLHAIAQECEKDNNGRIAALLSTPNFVPAVQRFNRACLRRWLESLTSESAFTGLPTPREIFRALYMMRTGKPSFLRPSLWQVASGICEARTNGLNPPQLSFAIRELIEMWRLSMALQHNRNLSAQSEESPEQRSKAIQIISATDATDWDFLPSIGSQRTRTHRAFAETLNDLVPLAKQDADSKDRRRQDYSSAALLTLDLVRTAEVVSSGNDVHAIRRSPECAPFVHLIESILKADQRPVIPIGLQEKLTTVKGGALKQYYDAVVHRLALNHISPLPLESAANAPEPIVDVDRTSNVPRETNTLEDTSDNGEALIEVAELHGKESGQQDVGHSSRFSINSIRKLTRAIERQDMYLVEKIRREVYAFAGTKGNDLLALPLALYEHLMLAFLTLRNPKAAMAVWDHIIQAGYAPTVRTYTVMMRGAQTSRDVSGMEAFWQKMRSAGYQPDEHAWAIRISGFFKLKLIQRGMHALNEMGQEWFAAAKSKAGRDMASLQRKEISPSTHSASQLLLQYSGPINDIPRPNLVVMNSAISALATTGDQEIPKVLTWGRSFGIEPDVSTYNALLNIAMRHAQADEALNILRRMNERGVKANSTTWTVLLTALLQGGFLDGLDQRKQEEKVINFIRSLEDPDGDMPGMDDKAYALVIDRLLKFHNNASAASTVLAHMIQTGRTPSTHIYTILISSYFQQEPKPNLAAIEALWKQLQSQNSGYGIPLDSIFYDRMIEGYATHHRLAGIQPALGFLKRARQAGQKPGWRALEAVARALAERSEWNRLRALVEDVRISLREARGATQHTGQRNFWLFIIDTGLFYEEGITRPEQLMPSEARRSPLLQLDET